MVSICTPPYTHETLATELLETGTHVIVEKPMASSLEECDRMIEAQRRTGKWMSVVVHDKKASLDNFTTQTIMTGSSYTDRS